MAAKKKDPKVSEPEVDPEPEVVVADVGDEVADNPPEDAPDEQGDVEAALPPEPERRGLSLTVLLGVALVIALAAGVAQLYRTGWLSVGRQDQIPQLEQTIAQLEARVQDMTAGSDAAIARLTELSARLDEMAASQDDLAGLRAGLETVSSGMTDLAGRISDLENRPAADNGASGAAVAAYEQELAAMREMLAVELEAISATQTRALAEQERAAQQGQSALISAMIDRLGHAVDTGAPLVAHLAQLETHGIVIPPLLNSHADGVASVAGLRADFPAVARAAIEHDIRSQAEVGDMGRVEAFFRVQLGARSLQPKDGNSADAVLSRAEAALNIGDLGGTLDKLAGLARPWASELEKWAARASEHVAVAEAVREIGSNG